MKKRPPGRPKGSPNKLTRAFREAVLTVFDDLGGPKALLAWAKANPTEFFKIAARMIPTEIVGPGPDGAHRVTYTWER